MGQWTMNIGDRVQSVYKGLSYIGRIVHLNCHDRIHSIIVTVQLEEPLVVDDVTLEKVYEQCKNLELVS